MGWISVKDRLPKTEMKLLFIYKENISFGEYFLDGTIYRWIDYGLSLHYRDKVTHWMPLPEVPDTNFLPESTELVEEKSNEW